MEIDFVFIFFQLLSNQIVIKFCFLFMIFILQEFFHFFHFFNNFKCQDLFIHCTKYMYLICLTKYQITFIIPLSLRYVLKNLLIIATRILTVFFFLIFKRIKFLFKYYLRNYFVLDVGRNFLNFLCGL